MNSVEFCNVYMCGNMNSVCIADTFLGFDKDMAIREVF